MTTAKPTTCRWMWIAVFAWIAFLLLSLKTGWLNNFYFDTSHTSTPGMDYFSVVRGWLNLRNGISEFDTFHSTYGPYASPLNYHPLLAVVVGAPMMFFSPWTGYAVWAVLSAGLLALSAWIIARRSSHPSQRPAVMLLVAGSFPAFILFQSGNVQALLVLAMAMIFTAMEDLRETPGKPIALVMLLAGLLISLFSKPTVLALVPLLLLIKETRRTTVIALATYVPVSFLSLTWHAWNPIALTWHDRWLWMTHPNAIAQTMNEYTNHFTVTRPMMDNAIHWFNMVGLTDFRFLHIDIYSLSALMDGWLGTHTPDALYRVPMLLVVEVSLLVALIRDRRAKLEAALMVTAASSLLLILSYGVVWEYHYTLVLLVTALLVVRRSTDILERIALALGLLAWLPSMFFFFRNDNMSSLHVQTILRTERVVPVAIMFLLLLTRAVILALRNPEGLRFLSRSANAAA